uniref:uncharacterized protein LOC122606635 isoform X2 n=1 Tax=Erigeron canadensis TaxID=72917 RepID=UPI001CB95E07|nr:uncharacterized protein LOC122606635 isoform X2 [Erigeron canadensis]
MAGNATFESASTSSSDIGFTGSYLNGQRGIRSSVTAGGSLVRSGNYREGSESRMFGSSSGFGAIRGDEFKTLSQCVSLEPIVMRDQISLCDEAKRVMGISAGKTDEEGFSGAAAADHVKALTPVAAAKDLKRFRSSVEDTCVKARANRLDERLRNLDKYSESVASKKQQRSESVSNDRAGALKGSQIYSINQGVEDRPKNILLNKRVRTSVAETRAEGQSNGLQIQPVAMAKDGNLLDGNDGESDLFEKIRRLAAGGEGWDKKNKRKRSVGTVSTRPIDGDTLPKRAGLNKIANERGSQQRDANINRLNSHDDSISNRKRPMPPPGSSSPPMAQWVGQRPQKKARVRRPNPVPPVPNQDQNQSSFENCSPSDVGARLTSDGTNGSPISKNATNGLQKVIVKFDNVQSPPQSSGNEESVGGETRFTEKKLGNSAVEAATKNKPPINAAAPKLLKSNRTGPKKNGSKPGRRLKKLSDRKVFSHHTPLQNSSSPECTGASDDDREELLAAANHARTASHLACSSAFWKKMEPVFASVTSENKSLLSQQMGPHGDSVPDPLSSGERTPHMKHQEAESFSGRDEPDKTPNGSIPFYQRVLSALIIEDDVYSFEEEDARNIQAQNASRGSSYDAYLLNDCIYKPSNGSINSLRSPVINNICEDAHSEVELLAGISNGFLNTPQTLQAEGPGGLSLACHYEKFCLDDKVLLELQSIGLCPDIMVGHVFVPGLNHKDDQTIQIEVDNLKSRLRQQEVKKKEYLEKISKGVESNSRARELEIVALDRLVELAYRKLLASGRNSRSVIHKVPKQVALAFGKRTLARCRQFEKSGSSCFSDPLFQDILSAPVENDPDVDLLSDEAFTSNRPVLNRGRKKELSLDDIGTTTSRGASYLGRTPVSSGIKGKRSERDTTKSRKPKPKQKMGQVPTSGNGSVNKLRSTHPTGPTWPSSNVTSQIPTSVNGSGNKPTRSTHPTGPTWPSSNGTSHLMSQGTDPTNPILDDLDPLDELGVGADLGGPADLNSFLNFDDQDIEEDFAGGLDIPMDDLTTLF